MSPPYPTSPTTTATTTTTMAIPDGSSGGGGGGGGAPRAPPPYAHISDLKERAVTGLNKNQSINNLLATATAALKQAEACVEYRRPDLAYVEYMRAFEIAAVVIPQHDNHPSLTGKRGPQWSAHQSLIKRINELADQFDKIKDIITNDNKRNATKPASSQSSSQPPSRYQSVQQQHQSPPQLTSQYQSTQQYQSLPQLPSHPQPQPPSQYQSPPPPRLNGTEALNERFARLRMQPNPPVRPDSRNSISSSVGSTMGSPTFSNRSSVDFAAKPFGPRQMPNGAPGYPFSSRMTLDTSVSAALPKAPSPTYSPARNMNTPSSIDPPRTSARSMVATGGRSKPAASSASSVAPGNDTDDGGYFPRVSADPTAPVPPRGKSLHRPTELRIGSERLYDYLKMHSILLIDVRPRDDFDDGHIYAQSVICIEPTALTPNMSAEQVEDALVLSPEAEQVMFYSRHKYDLVVYYDQATSSDSFIHRPSTERERNLKYLYDALYEYNAEKPLQQPPILLMGGIEGWADLVGDQALKRSNTVSATRAAKPIRRVPVASKDSRLYVPRRRLRDYNPLDAEEERKWHERARVESVVVDREPPADGDGDGDGDDADDDDSRGARQADDAAARSYQNIEEFLRRFPDAGSVEQRFGVHEHPAQLLPARPQQLPAYPSPAPPRSSVPPSIPSRPAPAVARVSYSGVSDRAASSQSTGSADLPAYVPARHQPANLRLPRTGLVNFGVTCYMNATIQALSATTPLTLFFLDDRFKAQVQRDNWKGSKGVLPELYANLVRSIWKGDVEAIRPSTLRSFCARLNSEWGIDRQQDAKEFLDFLVDCLHEDLNSNWARTPLRALTAKQEAVRERMPKPIVCRTEWGRYTHREQSYLTSLFGGQHASRLRCTTCRFTSTTHEAFYSISVEIPRSGTATLEQCLQSYCAEEMLSGDEVWKCPHCDAQREASKQITITRAPQFLVVHFKRFSAGRGESARKVRTPIDFPLTALDMSPYMLAPPTADEARAIAKDYGADKLKQDPAMQPPYLYDAYAVMRHIGTTLTSGHYTCLAKDRARGCWRQFNDTNVADFDPERLGRGPAQGLQNEQAYIVFYQRRQDA